MEQPDILKDTENRTNDSQLATCSTSGNDQINSEDSMRPDLLTYPENAQISPKSHDSNNSSSRDHSSQAEVDAKQPLVSTAQPNQPWASAIHQPAITSLSGNSNTPAQPLMTFLPQNLLPAPIMQPTPLVNPSANQIPEPFVQQVLSSPTEPKQEQELSALLNNNNTIINPNSKMSAEQNESIHGTANQTSSLASNPVTAVGGHTANPMLPFMLGMNPMASSVSSMTALSNPGLLSPLAAHIYNHLMQCEQIKNAGGVPMGLDVSKLLPLISLPNTTSASVATSMDIVGNLQASTSFASFIPSPQPVVATSDAASLGRSQSVDTAFCPTAQSTPSNLHHTSTTNVHEQHYSSSTQSCHQEDIKMDLHQQLPCRQCGTSDNGNGGGSFEGVDADRRSPQTPSECAYPKSETPKYKSTLLHRYLNGNLENKFSEEDGVKVDGGYGDTGSHSDAQSFDYNNDSGIQTTPNMLTSSAASNPLDLRKRIRNLSGSVGSQEYENISEAEASSLEMGGNLGPSSTVYSTAGIGGSLSHMWDNNGFPTGRIKEQEEISE